MKIRIVNGKRATDRRGAAEHLGRSIDSIKRWAANRAATGFPEPVDVERSGRGVRPRGPEQSPQGREWYALDDLDAFGKGYLGRARVHSITLEGDPHELLTGPQFAALLQVEPTTFRAWVRDSKDAWAAGRDGYLPIPDETKQTGSGVRRRWRRATAQRFIDKRAIAVPDQPASERPRR